MKLNEVLSENQELPVYCFDIIDLRKWNDITASGKYNPGILYANLDISNEKLTSIKGSPNKVKYTFKCGHNPNLTSLEGGPEWVGSDFDCNECGLLTMEFAPKFIGGKLFASFNKLTSLKNIHKQINEVKNLVYFDENPIVSNILGLLLIKGMKQVYIDNEFAYNIINKHLKSNKDVLECQEELISAGLKEFAKL